MAREDRVYRAAVGLESAARALAAGTLAWSEDLSSRVRRTLEDIDALVQGAEQDDAADGRLRRTLDRWKEIGIMLPDESGPSAQPAQVSEASRQFRQFAAHEVAGIIAEMEISLETLAGDPRNRDPLKAILRRQRAMLGAARLEEIPVVAEALRATEDMTRLIAKLNIPVKEEWLAVFRTARDVLKSALEPLQKGEIPGSTPALSKLRVLRQELLERFGEGEALNTASPQAQAKAQAQAFAQAQALAPQTPAPAPATQAEGVVPIEQLQYSGEKALRRALELQSKLEEIAGSDSRARESVDEVFDLIRLGIT
jgi:chemotaxis protein histidine kinase CheA